MKVAAIISEYNPFHNGHLYQIQRIKEELEPDYIIAVMSGDFVQRGAPAIIEKHKRTRMALEAGIDALFELPLMYASASARDFAFGAVSLLNALSICDYLVFGSEQGEISVLSDLSAVLADEPPEYKKALKAALKSGLSYPNACAKAMTETLTRAGSSAGNIEATLSGPNNTLGLEYMRALRVLHSDIVPYTIKRTSDNYHKSALDTSYSSATAIRAQLLSGNTDDIEAIQTEVPSYVFDMLRSSSKEGSLMTENDLSGLLKYALMYQDTDYTSYLGLNQALSNRIAKNLQRFTSYSDFVSLLKTKNMTYANISRCLLHIVLQLKKDAVPPSFVRMLGFRRASAALLTAIKENTSLPLVTKLSGALSEAYADDIRASNLYRYLSYSKADRYAEQKKRMPSLSEESIPIVIV